MSTVKAYVAQAIQESESTYTHIADSEKVSVYVPKALQGAKLNPGMPDLILGVKPVGIHLGRDYAILKVYSCWEQRDMTQTGYYYLAFPTSDPLTSKYAAQIRALME